jgi:hypothetical protein
MTKRALSPNLLIGYYGILIIEQVLINVKSLKQRTVCCQINGLLGVHTSETEVTNKGSVISRSPTYFQQAFLTSDPVFSRRFRTLFDAVNTKILSRASMTGIRLVGLLGFLDFFV